MLAPGEWRLQKVGEDYQLPLLHAAAFVVAVVILFFVAKSFLAPRSRR